MAALIAYREYTLGRGDTFGTATKHWLEVGGSAWFLYYAPITAYRKAIEARAEKPSAVEEMTKAKAERPAAMEEMVAETLRRLFLKPGADHYIDFIKELEKGGKLKELDIKLWISKVVEGEEASITYFLVFKVKRWLGFFEQELEAAKMAAEELRGRLPVKDFFSYMAGWPASDVSIIRRRNRRVLKMTASYLWQLAETQALFGCSVVGLRMSLTLERPKLQIVVEAPLKNLDEAIKRSAEDGVA